MNKHRASGTRIPLTMLLVLLVAILLPLGQSQARRIATNSADFADHRPLDNVPIPQTSAVLHTTMPMCRTSLTPAVAPRLVSRLSPCPAFKVRALSLGQARSGTLGYWHTQGDRIVDAAGRPLRIAAVNWGGMETTSYVPNGLAYQPLDAIIARIVRFGFNTIRVPFSNQVVEQNPIVEQGLDANPRLRGRRALDILDQIVASARVHGLRIVLDDHRSTAGVNAQGNGLWYEGQYSEAAWLRDWRTLVRRYTGDATVVGVDLRDEPHTGPPGPWSLNTYLHQGSTWGPYHGEDNSTTDGRLAAERAGNAILAINPQVLIFVEGLQQYPDPQAPSGLDSYWWGGALQAARHFPVSLRIPHQLVYSPHEYGPEKSQMPFFGPSMTYRSLSKVWERHWSFLLHQDGGTPIFVGEFGTCGISPRCVSDTKLGSQGLWFRYWMRFLRDHPEIGWAFWAVNDTNSAGQAQPNYVFTKHWDRPHLPQLLDALRSIEGAPPRHT